MNVTQGSFFKALPVQIAGFIAILFAAELPAASIVRVTYVLNDKPLGSAVYTGSDGGHSSDPVPYWSLISTPPEFGKISVEPDEEGGKVATLKGEICISLTIRNSISMGMVELDSLRLVRGDPKSHRWYIPAEEYGRVADIVKNRLKDTITVQYYHKGYTKLAQMIYYAPDGADRSGPGAYWTVLVSAPRMVDYSEIKPDEPGGKTATLHGEIKVVLNPRPYVRLEGNTRFPGHIRVDSLQLVRDHADSNKWRLPEAEQKRVAALAAGARVREQRPASEKSDRKDGGRKVIPPERPRAAESTDTTRGIGQPVELGEVTWGRDFEKAVAESRKTGKPLMVLFDEVPGCGGCKTYGKVLLSHPLLVEAAETLFVPVFIRNNDRDKNSADSKLLKRFNERAWNYPVVRFMNSDGKDIAPASRTWSIRGGAWSELLSNMVKALDVANRQTPKYLEIFVAQYGARKIATIQFAMGCFWTGEAKLGALPGVVLTRIGYHKLAPSAREIVEVVYDTERTDYQTIAQAVRQQDCARWIILSADDPNFETAKRIFGEEGVKVSSEPCIFKDNDCNYQFRIHRHPGYFFNAITPLQATRMHGDVANRADYLSPRQQALRERIEALFKDLDEAARKALFERMKKDLNPSQYRNLYTMTLNDYQKKLAAYLENLDTGNAG